MGSHTVTFSSPQPQRLFSRTEWTFGDQSYQDQICFPQQPWGYKSSQLKTENECSEVTFIAHPTGREFTSDWSINNFRIIFHERHLIVFWTGNSDWTLTNILTDNHCKIICRPVRNRRFFRSVCRLLTKTTFDRMSFFTFFRKHWTRKIIHQYPNGEHKQFQQHS